MKPPKLIICLPPEFEGAYLSNGST